MLNSLANHDFLPHDGRDITLDDTVHALHSSLNVNQSSWVLGIPVPTRYPHQPDP